MSEESVMSSRLRSLTEFTEDEGRDDTHQPRAADIPSLVERVDARERSLRLGLRGWYGTGYGDSQVVQLDHYTAHISASYILNISTHG